MGKQSTVVRTTSQSSIDQLFKNQIKKAKKLKLPSQRFQEEEDTDLQRAIRLSQRQHLEEQKRLLEQISQNNADNQPTSNNKSNIGSGSSGNSNTDNNYKSVMINNGNTSARKRRLIQKDEEEEEEEDDDDDDEDDWFQTVSTRAQKSPLYTLTDTNSQKRSKPNLSLSKKKKKKKDNEEESVQQQTIVSVEKEIVEIEDSQPLPQVKKEAGAVQESFEIMDDMSEDEKDDCSSQDEFDPTLSFAENLRLAELRKKKIHCSTSTPHIGVDKQNHRPVEKSQCPICQRMVYNIIHHAAYCGDDEKTAIASVEEDDSDSDCSVIDLIKNPDAALCDLRSDTEEKEDEPPLFSESPRNIYNEIAQTTGEGIEDDGYLSPLEGFTNINENNQEHNMYFAQLQNKPPKTKKTTRTEKLPSTGTKKSSTVSKRSIKTTTTNKSKKWGGSYKRKLYRKKR